MDCGARNVYGTFSWVALASYHVILRPANEVPACNIRPQLLHSTVHHISTRALLSTMSAPSPLPKYLYKILPSAPPSPLPERLPLSDLDRKDGFIHLSTSDQVASTADKWFDSFSELWLLKIKHDVLATGTDADGKVRADGKAEIKWEEAGRGVFAHFYGGDLGAGNVEQAFKVDKAGTWAKSLELEY